MSSVYLFPGQGSQRVGMGRVLFESEPVARAVFAEADDRLGYSLSTLCFEGPEAALKETLQQQPALFTTSIAAWRTMQARGWAPPAFVAGHSLGEFSALVAAGSLSFAGGLDLVQKRARLMQAAGEREPGGMAAILALDLDTVREICSRATAETGRPVQLANDNCPGQVVISGDLTALAAAMALAEAAGARKVVQLPISIAAHSPLMATAAAAFAAAVEAAPIHTAQLPLVGNVSARPLTRPGEIQEELKAQLTAPVAWTDTIRFLRQQAVDTFIEVGPGDVLLSLVKRTDRHTTRVKFDE